MLAAYTRHGTDVVIDWQHAIVDPHAKPEDKKAAGWAKLEVRNGELWATSVRWTANADAGLRAKEWRYISPTFSADSTRRPKMILTVSLTNIPATDNLEPLVAMAATPEKNTMPKALLEALGLAADASEAEALAALSALKEKHVQLSAEAQGAKELCAAVGADTFVEALAAVKALKASSTTLVSLQAEVTSLRAASTKVQLDALRK